ncbi:Pirin-related protein [Thermoplasmatales archaeon BRNA1]|nr:Pirin-related protein [Thermoplasmatales archaeon BRNA1]
MGIIFGRTRDGGPVLREQVAGYNWDCEDPFYLVTHHFDNYPSGNVQQAPPLPEIQRRTLGNDYDKYLGYRMYKGKVSPGFPLHTHWGYETLTYVSQGYVDHFDSEGNCGRFGFGDLQWVTASSRYRHDEMYPLAFTDRDNLQTVTQIFINLPLGDKNKANQVRTIWEEEIPVVEGEGWKATVIAGEFMGKTGPVPNDLSWAKDPSHHVRIVRLVMDRDAEIEIPASEAGTRNLYLIDAKVTVFGREYHADTRLKIRPDVTVPIRMGEGNRPEIWLLEGDPIGEKQASYGPVILGTDKEVRSSLRIISETEQAEWPWQYVNQKQPLGTERFFRDSQGRENRPSGKASQEPDFPPAGS